MTIKKNHKHTSRRPRDISDAELRKICNCLRKEVNRWCNLNPGDWFAARDLVGGTKSDWNGTPLQCLYENRKRQKSSDPVKAAGVDVGYELKKMLCNDGQKFKAKNMQQAWHYCRV